MNPSSARMCRAKAVIVARWIHPWETALVLIIQVKSWQVNRHKVAVSGRTKPTTRQEDRGCPQHCKPGTVTNSTWKVNARRSQVQSQPQLHREFQDILGHQTLPQSHPKAPQTVRGNWGPLKPSKVHVALHPSVPKALNPSLFGPL
jgi:hypothetical protein